jgi:hypothetical protein
MFVGAKAFKAEHCPAIFTHYKREEDVTMKGGKLDEELARMSDIADHLAPNAMLLFNESQADGGRTFKLYLGEPLQTSYGVDLYEEVFGGAAESTAPDACFAETVRD